MSEKRFLYRNFLEEEVEKRFTEEYDEEWGIYLSDNLTGDWYNINPVHIVDTCNKLWEQVVKLREENEQLKNDDLLFFQQVFNILMKYQHLFNREMADEVLEDLGIELTEWFE